VVKSSDTSHRLFAIVLESGVLTPILIGIEIPTQMIGFVGLTQGVESGFSLPPCNHFLKCFVLFRV